MRLRRSTILISLSALLAAACSGGQTGDLSGNSDDGGETAGSQCKPHKELLADLSTVSPLGFSAEEVLAFAEQSFEAPLSWQEVPSVAYGPEHGESTLELTLARGEAAYYVTYEYEPDGSGAELGLAEVCPEPHLSVDVHATVTSSGGALAESFDTALNATTPELATFSQPLDIGALGGAFEVTSFARPGAELVQMTLDASIIAAGFTGKLSAIVQVTEGDAVSAMPANFAVWPASEACRNEQGGDNSGIPVGFDESALGTTGAEALALLVPASPVSANWQSGSSAELTLVASSLGEGCARTQPYSGPGSEGLIVSYPISLHAATEDGQLSGEYAATLSVTRSGEDLSVSASAILPLELGQVAQSGFSGVVAPADADRLMLDLQLRALGEQAGGSVSLKSFADPPCLTEPPPPPEPTPGGGMSSPGCEGSTVSIVRSVTWGDELSF